MKRFTSVNDQQVVSLLKSGKVGIIRTDTLYGLVCRADDEAAVRKIYALKDRSEHKSPIVLIASTGQLFDEPPASASKVLTESWPGSVSIILPSTKAPKWLRRENESIAYRLPDNADLQQLIAATGPLVAPSANPEGHVPAMSINEAYDYFGDGVDFYVDGGLVEDDTPSRLLRVKQNGTTERLR